MLTHTNILNCPMDRLINLPPLLTLVSWFSFSIELLRLRASEGGNCSPVLKSCPECVMWEDSQGGQSSGQGHRDDAFDQLHKHKEGEGRKEEKKWVWRGWWGAFGMETV